MCIAFESFDIYCRKLFVKLVYILNVILPAEPVISVIEIIKDKC